MTKINENESKTGRLEVISDMLRLCSGCDCGSCVERHENENCITVFAEAADMLDEYADILKKTGGSGEG